MKWWTPCAASAALLASFASAGWAQPGVPGAPGIPAAGAVPPAAAPGVAGAAGAAPRNLWSFFCPTPEQKAACRAKICNTTLGKLLNNSLAPAGALTGGVIGPLCPVVSPEDLLKPPTSAEGAASRIKQDEAEAKERRAAVRYLGTVDCNYWPEAQEALIGSLRADRNECVRLEAALSLGRGCCCNKATIKALILTVTGSKEDGNPAETSDRVKFAASGALAHCLACFAEVEAVPVPTGDKKIGPPVEPKRTPDPEKTGGTAAVVPAAAVGPPIKGSGGYYARVQQVELSQLLQEAREGLKHTPAVPATWAQETVKPQRPGLVGLVRHALFQPQVAEEVISIGQEMETPTPALLNHTETAPVMPVEASRHSAGHPVSARTWVVPGTSAPFSRPASNGLLQRIRDSWHNKPRNEPQGTHYQAPAEAGKPTVGYIWWEPTPSAPGQRPTAVDLSAGLGRPGRIPVQPHSQTGSTSQTDYGLIGTRGSR